MQATAPHAANFYTTGLNCHPPNQLYSFYPSCCNGEEYPSIIIIVKAQQQTIIMDGQ